MVLAVILMLPAGAHAQSRRSARQPAPRPPSTSIRGFADVGVTTFSATRSFTSILGSDSGPIVGGGVEVVLPSNIFVGIRVARFSTSGTRTVLLDGEQFDLGIPTTVSITPIELSAGYRFGSRRARVTPYAAGGVGWHKYQEVSDFATGDENVDLTARGYHVLGGAEFRLSRWIGVAGEAQWTTVPDALGQDPNGVSAAFGETDLGGRTFRVKLIIGR